MHNRWFRRPVSPWTLVVFVVVVGATVGVSSIIRMGVENQNKELLKNEQGQVVLLYQTVLVNLRTDLRSLVYFTSASHNDPSVFAEQAQALNLRPPQSVALTEPAPGGGLRAVLAQGPDLHVGQVVPLPRGAVGGSLNSVVVGQGSKALLVVSAGSPVRPGPIAVVTTELSRGRIVNDSSGPYSQIYAKVFASQYADPRQLILSTYGPGSLPDPVAQSVLRFDSVRWLVQAAPRQSLVGSSVESQPWLVLLLGVLLALLLAAFVESLIRREHGAEHLAETTATELHATQRQLDRSELLAAMGEFTSVVGHELRNPLATVINEQYLLRMALGDGLDDRVEPHIENTEHAAYQAAQLIDHIRSYVRDREVNPSAFEFSALAAEALRSAPPPHTIEAEVASSTTIWADRALMHQVLVNLLSNAYEATPDNGLVTVGAVTVYDTVKITVHNSGSVVDPEVLDHLFDPFVTTKPTGTGLGLAIVRRFVELHNGDVSFDSTVVDGATVRISLPAPPEP